MEINCVCPNCKEKNGLIEMTGLLYAKGFYDCHTKTIRHIEPAREKAVMVEVEKAKCCICEYEDKLENFLIEVNT